MLRNKVTVERDAGTTVDSMGGEIEDFQPIFKNVPMDIQPISGDELRRFGRDTELISHRGYTEKTGILNSDRIIFKGRRFDVESVRDTDEVKRLIVVDMQETN